MASVVEVGLPRVNLRDRSPGRHTLQTVLGCGGLSRLAYDAGAGLVPLLLQGPPVVQMQRLHSVLDLSLQVRGGASADRLCAAMPVLA